MPADVKAIVSIITLIVAAGLAYWARSPIRPEFSTFVMVTGVCMVIAMWIFPEAGVKKGDVKKSSNPSTRRSRCAMPYLVRARPVRSLTLQTRAGA